MLAARLFTPEAAEGIEVELLASPVSKSGFLDAAQAICASDLVSLQRYVRTQFLCLPKAKWGDSLRDFINSVVTPSLQVFLTNGDMTKAAGILQQQGLRPDQIASMLSARSLQNMDDLNLKLGCLVAAGSLPYMVQGPFVRRIPSMKGEGSHIGIVYIVLGSIRDIFL